MRTTWQPFTSLLALSFLLSIFILTSCASHPDTKIAYFKNGQFDGCYKQSTYPDGRPFVPDPEGTSWGRGGNCTVSGGASCICAFTTKVC